MQTSNFNFSSKDGLTLFGRIWQAQGTPKGVVNLVHGLGEHSGRYAHVAEAMTEAGFHFIGFDLRGHGLSEGKRGHTPDFDHILDDVTLFLEKSGQFFNEDLPNFLYGHSLGGVIVLNYVLRRKNHLHGVISTDPALGLAFEPSKAKVFLGKIMANLMPSFSMKNGLEVEALSRDAAIVKAYQNDALVHNTITAKLAMALLDSGQYALDHANELDVPVLLMHGTADRIAAYQKSQEFAEKAGDLVTLKLWDDFYHELHNEIGKENVIADMVNWLNKEIK